MLVDGFVQLFEAGILKREVFDDEALQQLLNRGAIGMRPSMAMLDCLAAEGLIEPQLRARDLEWLQRYGIIRADVQLKEGLLIIGERSLEPNLAEPGVRQLLESHALGERLAGGVVMHGGFFLGPQPFYQYSLDLSEETRQKFCMSSVRFINDLYDHRFGLQALKVAQRSHGRFINSAMMQTLSGATVSDGLEDGRVISGVGGQYNFVAMAHDLPGARSILKLRSTRKMNGRVVSNIVFNYGHTTIPRHLRDIVITEYGIADLRGKSDSEVYQALIQISDSRFQEDLLRQAKKAGKVSRSWEVPQSFRENRPGRIIHLVKEMQQEDVFPEFPFGCPFTDQELRLAKALKSIKSATATRKGSLRTLLAAARMKKDIPEPWHALVLRMGLSDPSGWREKLDQKLLLQGLAETEA